VSKDFLPVVGLDPRSGITYGGAAAGLPWATAVGAYLADKVTEGRTDLDADFSPARRFPVDGWWGRLVPKPLAFAISQGVVKLT
jgi:gamma-glutamylputrescine oxidase